MTESVREAYGRRAAEYVEALGAMDSVHPLDELLVSHWAQALGGPVLDAGCGPGHWTRHLVSQGVDAEGIDQVAELVESARRTHPSGRYVLGNVDALPHDTASLGGVLSSYSLIHHEPAMIGVPLAEFARVLRPGGGLLLGFFEGPVLERFDHAVVGAYRWPIGRLSAELALAGFTVVETHTRTSPAHRSHGAVVARRAGAP